LTPYYTDGQVTLHHGDCREVTGWLAADVLVTDPPYGRAWRQGSVKAAPGRSKGTRSDRRSGIANDLDTAARDAVLAVWPVDRPALLFGDPMLPPPAGTKLVGFYRKPPDAGFRGAVAGFRRDVEVFYLLGKWPTGLGQRSSIVATTSPSIGNPHAPAGRYGHPHAKPLDVMEQLIDACPLGVIADPFAGSGSTLVAARNLGRKAIGVELDEKYCETIAKRLAQDVLPLDLLEAAQ
jgi:hypothetical protein